MPIQKILLVDDSKTELHVLSELLTKNGYAVRTAENGEEAMRREFDRLLPAMQSGRYIPSVDHQTPPDVSLSQ